MGAHCFFPHRFPTRHCPYNGFSAPCSSVNIVHSIRLSLFQIRSGVVCATYRFRGMQRLTLEEPREKEQTRKNKTEKREVRWEEDRSRGQQARGTRVNEIVRIANTSWRRRGCHEQNTLPLVSSITCSVCLPSPSW